MEQKEKFAHFILHNTVNILHSKQKESGGKLLFMYTSWMRQKQLYWITKASNMEGNINVNVTQKQLRKAQLGVSKKQQ